MTINYPETPSIDQTSHYLMSIDRIQTSCQIGHVYVSTCNGCGMLTRKAYSSGHLVSSHFGLAYVLIDETSLSLICHVFRTRISNITPSFSLTLNCWNSHVRYNVYEIQIETSIEMYTPFLNQIELTTWTICAFRVLNPRQWSWTKKVVKKVFRIIQQDPSVGF